MDVEEIKLRTIANLPTIINSMTIYPLSLKEIIDHGYYLYNRALNLISVKRNQLIDEEYANQIPDEITTADIIYHSGNEQLIAQFEDSLKLFLKTNDIIYDYYSGLIINNKAINADVFNEMIRVILIQNCFVASEEDAFNPLNERAKKIREKMLENKKKIQELNSDSSDEGLTLSDLISIVCSNANGINILNVFDLNMFQFNDQFNRMKMLDEYEINIQALLHGADSKEIQLKHWMSKIK
ncbi:hypothetical protein Elgi_36560 [Paenibacillus elgii]|uniref:hypothetical protein n=1 Tax=Paenibacillus elgii TaxID=189691 RepID=UPI002D7D97BA|nr:hypothetical protein Elgi_36560 [Paenibacillus elgii]